MGDVFGKGDAKSPAANAQARIAQQLYDQTNPLRQGLINRSTNFVGAPVAAPTANSASGKEGVFNAIQNGPPLSMNAGGQNLVTGSPTYLAYKDAADRNFARAKDNALATTPSGGALTDKLVDLEGNRASDLTQAAGNIYESELARAMTLATGSTGQSLGGLGQAGNTQAMLAQANADQGAAKSGALGEGLGAFIALKAA